MIRHGDVTTRPTSVHSRAWLTCFEPQARCSGRPTGPTAFSSRTSRPARLDKVMEEPNYREPRPGGRAGCGWCISGRLCSTASCLQGLPHPDLPSLAVTAPSSVQGTPVHLTPWTRAVSAPVLWPWLLERGYAARRTRASYPASLTVQVSVTRTCGPVSESSGPGAGPRRRAWIGAAALVGELRAATTELPGVLNEALPPACAAPRQLRCAPQERQFHGRTAIS
jgi:hypothetical protein